MFSDAVCWWRIAVLTADINFMHSSARALFQPGSKMFPFARDEIKPKNK